MVRIRGAHSLGDAAPADGLHLLGHIGSLGEGHDRARIAAALDAVIACYPTQAGVALSPRLRAAIDILDILALLGLDDEALVAGLLSVPLQDGLMDVEALRDLAGDACARLLSGVQRMDALRVGPDEGAGRGSLASRERQGERLRRMLVALIDDPRVALVKLAERVQAVRALSPRDTGAAAVALAREVMDIYAPLAHRLGVGQIKWEIEDLAFRHLHPDEYRRIAALLDERRADRENFIARATDRLAAALAAAGIEAEVSGRAKHLYSIWRKMQRKGLEISEVYDVRALRVMVTDATACYPALGTVHALWRNIPGEFDDYIANPKPNGYRSLHTAVMGEGGKVLEVQIRTGDMHREAEFGICAHWHYKGVDARGAVGGYEEKIGWLRQVLGWGEELDAGDLVPEHLRREAGEERVYVLTPDGHVVDLPRGATPVDFAYQVHTELGHRCRGARVDGRIVSLEHALATGERVEILRGKVAAPNREWLRPGNEFVHTARARAKIRHFFREQDREQHLAAGRIVLEREARRLSISLPPLSTLARALGQPSPDEMLEALGCGDITPAQLISALAPPQPDPEALPVEAPRLQRSGSRAAVTVAGVDNLMTQFAGCCRPLPGDAITGYVTGGRGVSVHRADCSKLRALALASPARILEVAWQGEQPRQHAVAVKVVAHDRPGLLRDLVNLLGNERINVLDLGTSVDRHRRTATVRLVIEIGSLVALGRVLGRIQQIDGVMNASRHLE